MTDNKAILVVDDSSSVRYLLSSTLSSKGYQTHEACDGNDALSLLDQQDVDMIISDLNMPGMDGAELVAHVRKLQGHRFTPFIVLSSDEDERKKQHARKAGASAWLNKPFKPEQLMKVVSMVLGHG